MTLFDLMEETIDVNKINVATKLAIKENRKKEKKNWYTRNITNIWMFLVKKKHLIS